MTAKTMRSVARLSFKPARIRVGCLPLLAKSVKNALPTVSPPLRHYAKILTGERMPALAVRLSCIQVGRVVWSQKDHMLPPPHREQMLWIAATLVLAEVMQLLAGRYRAYEQLVRDSVRGFSPF